jgi:hypothetical protein
MILRTSFDVAVLFASTFKITMEPMDIDRSCSSLLSSSSFEMKDFMSQGQLTTLNNNMTAASQMWQNSIVAAEGDNLQLRTLIQNVFTVLIGALARADIKNDVVVVPTIAMVESFDKDKLEQWKVVMQNCVEKNDWVDLIRTCVSDYRTVGLRSIVTTAALTIPTRPNAASTPLHLSRLLDREPHSK